MNPFDVAVAAIVMGSVVSIVTSYTRMKMQQSKSVSPDVEDRLHRIEQAVDAIATEVERLAESQQFTSRLLAERLPTAIASAPPPGGRP